jgi:all-trans-retinol 13,14-reductase
MSSNKYDIIIVGSGMGGLVSSVLLAKEGKKVLVLEKNQQFGGCLQTFSREKLVFDTGVHYIGSLGEGEILNRYFRYLEIMDELKLLPMDEVFDVIRFEGDKNAYPHAQGYTAFIAKLSALFPEDVAAIKAYCEQIQIICNSFQLYTLKEEETAYNLDYFSQSVADFLNNITQNKTLQNVLLGSNFLYAGNPNTTPVYIHALTVNSYIQSAWKCISGGSQLAKCLVKQLRKHNGEIKKRCEVSRFIVENGAVSGVETDSGERFYAATFISNVDINTTLSLVGKQYFRKSFVKRIENLPTTSSSFSLFIKLKPSSLPYFNHNIYYFNQISAVTSAMDNLSSSWPQMLMLSATRNEKEPNFAESLSLLTYLNFDSMKVWEATQNSIVKPAHRCDLYLQKKHDLSNKMIELASKLLPDIQCHIDSIYASTPLTYRDFIGGKNANLYGFSANVSAPFNTMVLPQTSISNLFLTGQSVNMHGILGTTIGAVSTCAAILGKSYLINKIVHETS